MAYHFDPHKRGTTFLGHDFELTEEDNTPVSLIGASIKMQVRKSAETPVVLEWKTADGSIEIMGASNNIIHLHAKSAAAMNIEPGKYVYDVMVTDADGVRTPYVEGFFTIINAVTRD
jgi:hypothetical protein